MLFLKHREELTLDADECLYHKLPLEMVKRVVLHLKLGRVILNVEQSGSTRAVDLETELE